MSYASEIRDEIARLPSGDICCIRSEFAAALCACGISFIWPNRYELNITSAEAVVVRRYFAMLKKGWGVTAQISAVETGTLGGKTHYRLLMPDEITPMLLQDCGLWDENELFNIRQTPSENILKYDCCRKAFVRSAFLMAGTLSNPQKVYSWEIAAPTEPYALLVKDCLRAFDIDADMYVRRGQKYVVYLKSAERVADALTMIGAAQARLNLESIRINKVISSNIHRAINCDNANINRMLATSRKQQQQIEQIHRCIGLDSLPESLKEMAQMRLNNPDISLSDLGDLFNPPLTKNAVNARMRRLSEIAEKLQNDKMKEGASE